MNENIDLTKILKDCPEGTPLYSTKLGDVKLIKVIYFNITYCLLILKNICILAYLGKLIY